MHCGQVEVAAARRAAAGLEDGRFGGEVGHFFAFGFGFGGVACCEAAVLGMLDMYAGRLIGGAYIDYLLPFSFDILA